MITPLNIDQIREAIELHDRIKSAARSLDWHTYLTDVLLAHDNKHGHNLPPFCHDVNTGAHDHAIEIAELLGVPFEEAIVAAREYVTGTRPVIVLEALRKFVALMDGKGNRRAKQSGHVRVVAAVNREPPPSVHLAKLNGHGKGAHR